MPRRVDRINEQLRQEISRLLTLQTKDPRLTGVISVTRVDTARDLRNAKVYISVLGNQDAKQSTLEGIRSAAGYLRRELRSRLAMRYTPFLSFQLDETLEESNHILGLMDRLREDRPDGSEPQEPEIYLGPLPTPTGGN